MWLLITRPQKLQLYTTDYTRVQLLLETIHHPTTVSSCHRLTEKALNNHFSSTITFRFCSQESDWFPTARPTLFDPYYVTWKNYFREEIPSLFLDSFPISLMFAKRETSACKGQSVQFTRARPSIGDRARALIAFEVKYKSTLHTPRIGWQFDKALKFLDPAKTINRYPPRVACTTRAVNCKFLG